MAEQIIVMAPVHLKSLRAICDQFGKAPATVRDWRRQGAPIAFDGRQYCAEYNTLMGWLLRR